MHCLMHKVALHLCQPSLTLEAGTRYRVRVPRRDLMSQKQERQQVIQELVATRSVGSQEELRQLLAERGWDVTQSTLSRDMHDLRLARVPTPGGVRYTTAETASVAENRATLASLVPQLFEHLDSVRE